MTTLEMEKIHRDLGRLEGTVEGQRAQLVAINAKQDAQTDMLRKIETHIAQQRGAIRVVMWVASALGAGAGLAASWFKGS
jgi:hypothetical protein